MTPTVSKLKLEAGKTYGVACDRGLSASEIEVAQGYLKTIADRAGVKFVMVEETLRIRSRRRSWLSTIRERIQKFAKT